jgi:translation initiation factor eIF-2B subunit delta
VSEVRDDREHGASWLARRVTAALGHAANAGAHDPERQLAQLHAACRAFVAARPSMAAIANSAAHIWAASVQRGQPLDAGRRAAIMAQEAQALLALWSEATAHIFAAARPLLTGMPFTLSRSGTVEEVLLQLVRELAPGGTPRLLVSESRPGGEGVTTARVLAHAGWQVTLVADAACGAFVNQANVVVVGADSLRADGSLVNKVGTYPLALAAAAASVPVYVLCETLKIAAPGFPLALEEMDPRELLSDTVDGIVARNIYFDHTPPHLLAGVVTERGLLTGEQIGQIADQAGRALDLLLQG